MFKRLKQLFSRGSGPPSGDVSGDTRPPEEVDVIINELIRDITNINTALQRIERKQNRWIEMLNLQDAMKTPTPDDGEKEAAVGAKPRPTPLTPGQIVA